MDLPDPPSGWHLKFLNFNEEDGPVGGPPKGTWSVNLWSDEAYVYGTGSTPRFAMLDALAQIERDDVFERLSGGMKVEKVDLVALLGIKSKPMVRRG